MLATATITKGIQILDILGGLPIFVQLQAILRTII